MATTYAQAKNALNEITTRIVQNRNRLTAAQTNAATAEADFAAMPAAYTTIIQDIDAAAAAAPLDAALQNLKAEKDKLVGEFGTLRPKATDMKNATAAITF